MGYANSIINRANYSKLITKHIEIIILIALTTSLYSLTESLSIINYFIQVLCLWFKHCIVLFLSDYLIELMFVIYRALF